MTAVSNPTRKPPPPKKKLVQKLGWACFVGGGILTPHLAARAAARLWCKLPGNPGRRKDNRASPGHTDIVDVGLRSPMAVETWGEGDRLVYLVHGWGGWRGQVSGFVGPLVQAGFKVIAFDSPSHGDSGPGKHGPNHSSGGEMIEGLEAVAAHFGQPHGVIAHSLGCASICRAILDGKVTAAKLTLVSPNPDMREIAAHFAVNLGFRPRTQRLMVEAMEQWAHRGMGEFDVADMGATGLLPPALVIHDSADKESPYTVAQKIDAQWPEATLMTTDGLGHHRILINQSVVKAATDNIAA